MADEVIRFGAGGMPYKPTTPQTVFEIEESPTPEPAVTVKVVETESLGEIPKEAKKRTAKEDVVTETLGTE